MHQVVRDDTKIGNQDDRPEGVTDLAIMRWVKDGTKLKYRSHGLQVIHARDVALNCWNRMVMKTSYKT